MNSNNLLSSHYDQRPKTVSTTSYDRLTTIADVTHYRPAELPAWHWRSPVTDRWRHADKQAK